MRRALLSFRPPLCASHRCTGDFRGTRPSLWLWRGPISLGQALCLVLTLLAIHPTDPQQFCQFLRWGSVLWRRSCAVASCRLSSRQACLRRPGSQEPQAEGCLGVSGDCAQEGVDLFCVASPWVAPATAQRSTLERAQLAPGMGD